MPCVVADGETLYCSGGRTNRTLKIQAGGRGDVTKTHLTWEVDRGANVTSPLLVNGYLFWAHDKSIALCVRASDGKEMFRERMPTRSRVYGSIVSDGTRLFLTTRDSGVLVLDASPEYRELAVNKLVLKMRCLMRLRLSWEILCCCGVTAIFTALPQGNSGQRQFGVQVLSEITVDASVLHDRRLIQIQDRSTTELVMDSRVKSRVISAAVC